MMVMAVIMDGKQEDFILPLGGPWLSVDKKGVFDTLGKFWPLPKLFHFCDQVQGRNSAWGIATEKIGGICYSSLLRVPLFSTLAHQIKPTAPILQMEAVLIEILEDLFP